MPRLVMLNPNLFSWSAALVAAGFQSANSVGNLMSYAAGLPDGVVHLSPDFFQPAACSSEVALSSSFS